MAAADVVVVGGGIIGTAAAYFLADAGMTVVLVERDVIGAGASGRNSGVVQQPFDPVLAALYAESVPLYRRLVVDSDRGFEMADEPAGLLYATRDRDVAAALAERLTRSHPELAPTLLEGAALRELEPAIAPGVAACRVAIGFPVEPDAATLSYAELAWQKVRFVHGRPASVTTVHGRATGVVVDGRSIAAGTVVVAAGPWTPEIVEPGGRWRPIRPNWGVIAELLLDRPPGHVIEEAELDDTIEPRAATGSVGDASAAPAVGAFGFSLVTAGGRSALGSTFLEHEPDPDPLVPRLVERGARFVPAIATATVLSVRRCARPLSVDGRPLIGRVPWVDGLFVAAGHGPWGISTGPGSARLVTDLVLNRVASPPAALDPARFGGPR